jgi:hypothetical protein
MSTTDKNYHKSEREAVETEVKRLTTEITELKKRPIEAKPHLPASQYSPAR